MSRIILLFLLWTLPVMHSFAQEGSDSTVAGLQVKDKVFVPTAIPPMQVVADMKADSLPFLTPKKIGLFSAIVPGLGQLYNKQYWKAGIVYVGVGAAVYFLADNMKNYNAFRKEYAGRSSNDPDYVKKFPEYSDLNTIKLARDYYRRNLDLTVLFTGLGYTLQILDAVVFAHLKGFDISEDISLNARPVLTPQGGLGFGLVMKF